MNNLVTFNSSARKLILDALAITEDSEGYLVEKANPSVRVLSSGDDICEKELGAIKQGSLLFFKSDLPSLIELADSLE